MKCPIIMPLIVHGAASATDIEPSANAAAAAPPNRIRMVEAFRESASAKRRAPARSAVARSLRTRAPRAEDNSSMTSSAINMYVFFFAFASAFLLGQKRPMLALSTRALLAVLLGLALGYAVAVDQWYRSYLGVATLIANVLFVAFASIDFLNWQKKRLEDRG
jgi:hypothetical protein